MTRQFEQHCAYGYTPPMASDWELELVDGSTIKCTIADDTVSKVFSGKYAFMEYIPLGKTMGARNWVYINVDRIATFKRLF